jgi:hypothetical protein
MKKIILLFVLITSNLYGQDYIKKDSIFIANKKYETVHISYGNSSGYKAFIVLAILKNDLDAVKNKIIQCYSKNKYERTEIYLIEFKNNKLDKNVALEMFYNKIDDYRMKNNLYTALIPFSVSPYFKFTYHLEQKRRSLNELDNLHFVKNTDNICDILHK